MDPDVIDLSVYHVMHNTCIKHGEDIKTQDIGSTSILCKKIVPFPVDQNTFLSWKHKLQRWRRNNSWQNGENPLLAVAQVTSQVTSKQCWTRLTLTSEYLDCPILLWNKLRPLVFVSWSRRSRTTLTDMLFNAIYNKKRPTNVQCGVKANGSGRGQRRLVWTVRDGP